MSNAKPYSGGNQPKSFSFPPQPFEGQRVSGLGQNYEFDGTQWRELAAQVDASYDFGTGLSLDESATPPIVNLQPAQSDAIGGIMEPPTDGLPYARTCDGSGVASWVAATAVSGQAPPPLSHETSETGGRTLTLIVSDGPPDKLHPGLVWWEQQARSLWLYLGDDAPQQWVLISRS